MHIHQRTGYTTIHFKSIPYQYIKERDGMKSNTVRVVNDIEDEQIKQSNIDHILIEDTMAERSFSRKLTDITRFSYKDIIIYTFSWN